MTPPSPAPATSTPTVQPATPLRTAQGPIAQAIEIRLRRFLIWAVLILSAGYTFLDYWNYSRMWHAGPQEWADLLAGRGLAPAQYRIGVLHAAAFLAHHSHTQLRHMFALIDLACLLLGLFCILALLSRTTLFRLPISGDTSDSPPTQHTRDPDRLLQWTLSLLCLGLFTVYLSWTFWYQKPETLPTLAYLALSALLAASHPRRALSRCGIAALLLLLAVLQATIRADAAIAFHLGMLIAALLPRSFYAATAALRSQFPTDPSMPDPEMTDPEMTEPEMPLGRVTQAVTSSLAILAAAAVQYGIIHWLYPHAQRNTEALQLLSNLRSPLGYLPVALALAPWWVTLWLSIRRRRTVAGSLGWGNWTLGLLFGSLAHFAMFLAFGMASEVRIFLPFAMAVLPATTVYFYRAFISRVQG